MKTNFTHARVRVAPGIDLVVDGNSKITASNGSFAEPAPNALSLPAASVEWSGPSCPGSTPTCRATCYVKGLAKYAPEVYAVYHENFAALTWLLDKPGTREEAARRLGAWIAANAAGGFRWHVSGDVLNLAHARWIVDVCHASPDVGHWIYTRTFDCVPALLCAQNLTVNVSADVDNYAAARAVATAHRLRVCYEATGAGAIPGDHVGDVVTFPDYALRGRDLERPTSAAWWQSLTHEQRKTVCPADFYGQSEAHRCGPCSKCLVRT
jgi:hypothetical protein